MHAETPGIFEVEGAVVDEHGSFGRTLGEFECDAIDGLFRLAGIEVTGAEEGLEILAQAESLDAVIVEFTGLVIDGSNEVFAGAGNGGEDGAGLGVFPGLSKHKSGELFAGERPGPVEESAIEILVEGDLSGVEGGEGEVVALAKFFPVQAKVRRIGQDLLVIPAIGEDDAANIPEQRSNRRHGNSSKAGH